MHLLALILMTYHRDLKLDNLLLVSQEENSSIKIIDFGLMVSFGSAAATFQDRDVVGTEGIYFSVMLLLE